MYSQHMPRERYQLKTHCCIVNIRHANNKSYRWGRGMTVCGAKNTKLGQSNFQKLSSTLMAYEKYHTRICCGRRSSSCSTIKEEKGEEKKTFFSSF